VSEPVTSQSYLSFNHPTAQPGMQTPLVKALFGIQGVNYVSFKPYEVNVHWSGVFTPEEMVPKLKKLITKHLAQ
jgi:hypothetical protein